MEILFFLSHFETIRIIKEIKDKPKWIIWENVKGVLDRNMRDSFFIYLKELEDLGYESKYEILNAMDFGIPQKKRGYLLYHILEKITFLLINWREQKLDH